MLIQMQYDNSTSEIYIVFNKLTSVSVLSDAQHEGICCIHRNMARFKSSHNRQEPRH